MYVRSYILISRFFWQNNWAFKKVENFICIWVYKHTYIHNDFSYSNHVKKFAILTSKHAITHNNYFLYGNFDLKIWFACFFTRFNRENRPQINFSRQTPAENCYLFIWLASYPNSKFSTTIAVNRCRHADVLQNKIMTDLIPGILL